MRMRNAVWFGLGAGSLLCSCLSAAEFNTRMGSTLLKRAAFELNCPEEQLQLTPLDTAPNGRVTSQGVSGCNQRAVYLLQLGSNTWVLNSETQKRQEPK